MAIVGVIGLLGMFIFVYAGPLIFPNLFSSSFIEGYNSGQREAALQIRLQAERMGRRAQKIRREHQGRWNNLTEGERQRELEADPYHRAN